MSGEFTAEFQTGDVVGSAAAAVEAPLRR